MKICKVPQLLNWIEKNGLSFKEAGQKVGKYRDGKAVTAQTIKNVLFGARQPSPGLSRALVEMCGGQVSLSDLRPDVWPPES